MNRSPARADFLIRERGLTLVELMVSLVLSLVLLLGALQLFSGSKDTYRLSDALAQVQENGRFAMNMLARDVRQAGYTGCIATPDFSNVLNGTPLWQYDFPQPVFGYEIADAPDELKQGGGAGNVASNPDALVVLFGDALEAQDVTGPIPPSAAAELTVAAGLAFEQGQPMIVTDCSRATLFEVSSDKTAAQTVLKRNTAAGAAFPGTDDTPGNCTANLHDTCGSGIPANLLTPYAAEVSRILPMRAHGYYLANTNRRDADDNIIVALYRQRLTANGLVRDELLEGVTAMQVNYGVAPLNGRSAESYVSANDVADWGRVVSVRVDLTVQAVSEPTLIRDFSTTVALRNRTL